MAKQLVSMPGCHHIHQEIRKLPSIEGYSKHLLPDGNPRCLAFHRIKKNGLVYALLEVDTSDNKNRLSTLLLKQQDLSFDWERRIRELEIWLLKGSLTWPTKFINKRLGRSHRRISHPKTSSENKALMEQESIRHWAERIYKDMYSQSGC